MKKFFFFFIASLLVILFYFYSTHNEYKRNLSTTSEVGLATDIYLVKFKHYPYKYSEYLFNKYERQNLYKIAENSPNPYLDLMGLVYGVELKEDLDYLYSERIYEIEDKLICIGLSQKRVDIYRQNLIGFHKDTFFAKKYNSFKDNTVFNYCRDR